MSHPVGRLYRKIRLTSPRSYKRSNEDSRALVLPYEHKGRGIKRPTLDGTEEGFETEFTYGETWGALKKCWRVYKIAAKDWHGMKLDKAEALKYALRIGNFSGN